MGTGADGALVLFDIDGDPNDDRYFVPTDAGISLTQFENGIAYITGQVMDSDNEDAILNVNILYDQGVSGADWDGGFKSDQNCAATSDITDQWMIYIMNADQSYLTGEGDLDGTLLTLNHAPSSEYFGFQVGLMANDRNCNEGAGGWFSYEGTLAGTAIQGGTGDVLLDIDCTEQSVVNCSEDLAQSVVLIYTAIDTDCGDALTVSQVVSRDDTTDPTWDNAPANETVACADGLPEVPTVTASDNCEADDGEPTVEYTGQTPQYDIVCAGTYKVDRTWTATDCSGNMISHTQTIQVQDLVAPVISGGQDYDAECDGEGNADELANFLTTQGGATATDDCGTVTWSHDYEDGDLSDDCGATGTVDVTFTAADDCLNESTITLTFTIEDETAPVLTAAPMVTVACEEYDPTAIYQASATDACGDATVSLQLQSQGSGSCAGTYLHTYIATDECGNDSDPYQQIVNLVDQTAPVPSVEFCPADQDLFTDANCEADTTAATNGMANGSATDNCDNAPEVTISYADVVTQGCTGSYSIARTWTVTATDHCDLTSSTTCLQTITVSDNIAPVPVITCPDAYTVDADENCNADTTPAAAGSATATATDNCDSAPSIDIDYEDGAATETCDGSYSFTRTWTATATDACENSASTTCTQLITVEDNTAPTWDEYDVYVNAACEDLLDPTDPTLVPISASDNCSEVITYSIAAYQLSGGCPGTWMRVWTATDDCGNISETTEQYVQLFDIIDPEPIISCPAAFTAYKDADCNADTTPGAAGTATATVTDNCDSDIEMDITHEDSEITETCDGSYYFTRTWTATAMDDCDNTATDSCDQLITVTDNTAPVIEPASEDHTVECDGAGNAQDLADWLADNGGAEATDNCSAVTWSHDYEDGDLSDLCAATGSVDVIFTASDDCGNTSTTSSTFTIQDTTAPEFSGDYAVDLACDQFSCDADALEALGLFSVTEECGDYTLTADCTPYSGNCVTPIPAYSVTITATDECGNSTDFDQIINLFDDVNPVPSISCPVAAEVTADADCNADLSTENTGMATASATDNCDASPEVSIEYTDGEHTAICAGSYSFTRTFTATAEDHCGNTASASCDQLITVLDETAPSAPVFDALADAEVFLDANCATDASTAMTGMASATSTDNCDGDPSMSITHSDSAPVYTCTADDGLAHGSYTFTRTFTAIATDDCNNASASSTLEQTITVTDNTAPDFAGSSAEFEIDCDEYSADAQYEVMADDNCDLDVTITILSNMQVSGSCAGTVLRTYKAVDDCGNEETFMQTIDLLDDEAPELTISCPGNADLTTDASCSADTSSSTLGMATYTADDNCDEELEISLSYADVVTPGCTGSYTVARTFTLTAEDHCENSTTVSCTQTITVSDQTNPDILTGASNATVECDGSGNTGAFNMWLNNYGGASATDACSAVTWSNNSTGLSDDCGATGSETVIFTATDACGNMSTTSATFTIEDTTPPSIIADLETSVPCDEYNDMTNYAFSASDVCSGDDITVVISDQYFSGPCAGTINRTYTVTDDCENEATFDQIINLTDDEAPTFDLHCPDAIINISADAADCSADTSVETNGSATFSNEDDNCDTDVDMEVSHADSQVDGCAGSYVITRVWTVTATDHCDNVTSKTCTQTITVTDDTAPTIGTAASAETVECDGNGNLTELNAWLNSNGGASATDACGDVSWSYSPDPAAVSDECGATGSVEVTFTATDECGNASETVATFAIEDNTAPSLSIVGPASQSLDQNATCNVDTSVEALGNVEATATDVCGSASTAISHVDGAITYTCANEDCSDTDATLEGSYSFVRTFTVTATDECGLTTSDTYNQTITVTDISAPQFTQTCGLANGDAVPVCCEDLMGTVTIPGACATEAADNCDSDVCIDYTEVYVGEYAPQPGSGVVSYCESSTPEAYADGEACNGLDPHSFSLFNFDGELRVDFASVGTGTVAQMDDGTWVLTQELIALNGTGGLLLDVTYGAAQSWTEWYTPGQTNYKRDCGVLVDDHENWDYRILQSGSLEGTGDYSGLSLSLAHAPANEYYAFQVGLGANNQNDNYGYSGWVMASGTHNEENVFFSGDLFGDLDCCLPWSITRDYVASDDCGNSTPFGYTIDVNGESCTDSNGPAVSGSQDEDHGPSVMGGAGDVTTGKSPIRVTNLMPNPTNDLSMLGFTVTENMRLRVDMFTMDGLLVGELFDGVASPNVNNTLNIQASDLESGMYQIRLSSAQYLVVKKLLVTE